MIDNNEETWGSIIRSAGEALEERPRILAELERLREVESQAMRVCTTYLFKGGDTLDRIESIREEVKKLHGTIHDGRKKTKGAF